MTAGQISDYTGASVLLDILPAAQWMLGDRGMMPTGSGTPWKRKV
ncbi:transposase, IS4 family protein [Gluconobacter morbifer G707]|uniref:Transposase, IS4 family protein n=1 Tax=Gluconobacter morbifer G707 TaxID=1088869 RepID=G6XMX5_9PROT|nr:transposase, IS4 family protein [Gluconobacter morbifer G707]